MQTEPSVIIGGITAFATALIGVLVAFGLDLDQQQQSSILGLTAVVAPLIASIVIRFRVFSPATTQRLTDEAYAAGVPPTQPNPPLPAPPAEGEERPNA